jgi:hypothetical protein
MHTTDPSLRLPVSLSSCFPAYSPSSTSIPRETPSESQATTPDPLDRWSGRWEGFAIAQNATSESVILHAPEQISDLNSRRNVILKATLENHAGDSAVNSLEVLTEAHVRLGYSLMTKRTTPFGYLLLVMRSRNDLPLH